MNYRTAQKDLEKCIESFINIYYVKQNRNSIIKDLKDRIPISTSTDVMNSNMPVKMLSEDKLYYFLVAFAKFYQENKEHIKYNESLLDPKKYFDEREITKYKTADSMDMTVLGTTYTFQNVYKVDDKQYMIPKITAKEILEVVYGNFIKYSFEMQRESEKAIINGVTYERPKIYQHSIREIKENMKAGLYRPTALSINILQNEDDEDFETHYEYDEENHTFTISREDLISLIDGMHRLYTLMECCNEDDKFDQIMQLNIFVMGLKDARHYIYQEGQKNAISKEVLTKYNSADVYAILSNEIEKAGSRVDNLLQGRVGNDKRDVLQLNKFTTYSKIRDAISDNFQIKSEDNQERRRLKVFLTKFYSEVLSIHHKELESIMLSRETSLKLHCNMIYAYTCIAKRLRGLKDWEDYLTEIIDGLDFEIDGTFSQFIGKDIYEITKRNKTQLYTYINIYIDGLDILEK